MFLIRQPRVVLASAVVVIKIMLPLPYSYVKKQDQPIIIIMITIKSPKILNTLAKQLNNAAPCQNNCQETIRTPFVPVTDLCETCQSIVGVISNLNLVPEEDSKLVRMAADISYKKFNPRIAFILHVVAYNKVKSDTARTAFEKAINEQLGS